MTTQPPALARKISSGSERFLRFHLKTRHMVLLVELGRHRSILDAAKAANLTQPGASRLLSELEHALGIALFERLPRGITPTLYGKIMIRRAGAALAEMDAAHQEVMELQSGDRGRVTLGSVLTPAASLVPEAVNLLKTRHPGIHVTLVVETSKLLVERLRTGELDLLVGRILDPGAAAELDFEPVADEPHQLIARAGHPWALRTELGMAEIAQARWILPPAHSMLRDRLMMWFLSHGLDQPRDTIETMSLAALPGLLTGSDAVVALPPELVRCHLDAGLLTVLPVELGLRADVYGIVTRKNHQLSPGAEAMLEALRSLVATKLYETRIAVRR